MRDVDTIDRELRLLAVVRTTARDLGGRPATERADQLLDERLTTAVLAADELLPGKPPPTADS